MDADRMKTMEQKGMGNSNGILLVLSLYLVTFFVYKDFGIPLSLGFFLLGLVVAGTLLMEYRRGQLYASPIDKSMLVILALFTIQYLRPDAKVDIDTIMLYLVIALFIFAGLAGRTNARELEKVLILLRWVAIAFGAYIIFFALFRAQFQHMVLPHLAAAARGYYERFLARGYNPAIGASYTYSNYILFAGIASILPGLRSKVHSAPLSLLKDAHFYQIIFLWVAMFLTQRRGELGIASILILGFLCSYLTKRNRRRGLLLGAALLLLLLALIIFLAPYLRHWDLISRYIRTVEKFMSKEDITAGRISLYRLAWEHFQRHPFWGIGWRRFGDVIPFSFKKIHGMDLQDVHNNFLQLLTETGSLFAFLFTALYLRIECGIFRDYRRCRASAVEQLSSAGNVGHAERAMGFVWMMQLFFLLLGLIDPTIYKIVFWCISAICLLIYQFALGQMAKEKYE